MSISLGALEAALSEIEHLGHEEVTFQVWNTTITMRTLMPEEEHEVQQYAAQAWTEDNDNDSGEALRFVDLFRRDTIARAIIQVGDQDLRGIEYVETGEVLNNGKPVKEPTHKVLRDLVGRWGGPIRTAVFKKYTELVKKAEARSEAAIEFEPSDTATEISRLEERLAELKASQEHEKIGRTNPVHAIAEYGDKEKEALEAAAKLQAEEMVQHDTPQQPETQEAPAEATPEEPYRDPLDVDGEYTANPAVFGPAHTRQRRPQPQPRQQPQPQQPGQRQPILPTAATPPTKPQGPAPASQAEFVDLTQQNQPAKPQVHEEGIHWEEGGSFVSSGDLGSEVARENARLAHARATGQPLHPPAESALMAVHGARRGAVPPHVAAMEAAQAAQEISTPRGELQGTTADGHEVYSMNTGVIDLTPGAQPRRNPQPPPPPARSTRNPRYKKR